MLRSLRGAILPEARGRVGNQIDVLISMGVDGVYCNGTAGEFHSQTEREFDQITISLHTMLSFDAAPDTRTGGVTLIGSPQQMADTIGRCRELGVSHMVLSCFYGIPALLQQLEVQQFIDTMHRFAEDVLSNH